MAASASWGFAVASGTVPGGTRSAKRGDTRHAPAREGAGGKKSVAAVTLRSSPVARRRPCLEARTAREPECLRPVAAETQARFRVDHTFVLGQGDGVVEADRAERRLPENAGADRGAEHVLVANID